MLFFLIPEETYNSEHLKDISLLVANISFSNLAKEKGKKKLILLLINII